MPDSTLAEALEWYENTESLPTPAIWELQPIVDAARQVVSGTPIRWCEEHEATYRIQTMNPTEDLLSCDHARTIGAEMRTHCRIVDRILIDPKEET